MAIFHASMKTISRAKGHSATAAAAYRAGIALTDDRTGQTHDFRRRKGVERVRFLVPSTAPAWALDAARLWNAAEASETRSNSCVARELIVALPCELDRAQRVALADDIARMLVDRYRVAVMLAIHEPDARGDARNFHAHLLFSTRTLEGEGFGAKIRCLDDRKQGPKEVEGIRRAVADLTNVALTATGSPERVDPRSLRAQARAAEDREEFARAAMLTREPTEHVGPVETAAARRGQGSKRAAANAARHVRHRAALARFLLRAETEGRLMPPASDRRPGVAGSVSRKSRRSLRPSLPGLSVLAGPVHGTRATGQDAAVLNEQAALSEQGARMARESAQAYVDQLKAAAEQYRAIVDAYLRETGRHHQRALLLVECAADARCADLLRRSTEARQALRALRAEVPERRRRYGAAMAKTAKARRDLEAIESKKPPAWRPMTRRQWAEKRRAQRSRLGEALAAEGLARTFRDAAAVATLKERADELRAEVSRVEAERRTYISSGADSSADEAPDYGVPVSSVDAVPAVFTARRTIS